MKFTVPYYVAGSLLLNPLAALAADPIYPRLNLPDRGARLGIVSEQQLYKKDGITVIKIMNVLPVSPLFRVLAPGDYLYGVNGFNLRSHEDIDAIVSSNNPGAKAEIFFFDASDGLKPKTVTVSTVSANVFDAPKPQPKVASSTPSAPAPGFCDEHPIICGAAKVVAVVGGAIIVGKLLSESNIDTSQDRGGGGGGGGARASALDEQRNRANGGSNSGEAASEKRTYGLYGNCPQPGAGYGC